MAHNHSDSPINRKALLITVGNTTLEGCDQLYYAQRDAQGLKCLLIDTYGYPEENITLMADNKSLPRQLWPTKKNIRKQIQLLVQGVSAGDRLFFSYSGHGRQVSCHHHTELDGLDEAIFTCKGELIIDNDLKEWLVNPLPRGCKLFSLWDSCHSQTILDLDHYDCNEPRDGRCTQRRGVSNSRSIFHRVLPKSFRRKSGASIREGTSTVVSHELRGRPIARASVSITAVSAGNSPPFSSKWIFFSEELRRVLSPPSWFPCNGECPSPLPADMQRAHVVCLSACKDNETAVDDSCRTFTKFFIDHLSKLLGNPVLTMCSSFIQGAEPKSTLNELLLAIRRGVDEITTARQEYDARTKTRVVSRSTTYASGTRVRTEWIPQVVRRNTEVNVNTLEGFLRFTPSKTREETKYSQQPSYSSHYPLDLDELVDL